MVLGNEHDFRNKVENENRVTLLAKGPGVVARDFGHEGTGGHSHLDYHWKAGVKLRFLLAAQPKGNATIYTGYFFHPEQKKWGLIARFKAPKDGGYLRGMHSFEENYIGHTGNKQRIANYGNQWIKTDKGKWIELLKARFTHDKTGRKARTDYTFSVEKDTFRLTTGGYISDGTRFGKRLQRVSSSKNQPTIRLPKIPALSSN